MNLVKRIIRNAMSWIKNSSTVVISVFVAFLIAEVFLRILGVGYGNAPLERSKTYSHVHPTSYEFFMYDPDGEYGGYKVFYDELGRRVPSQRSQTTQFVNEGNAILFLGDSFTEGNQVPYDDTFVSLVGETLGSPTLNFGVSSYSPMIYQLQAKNVLPDFKGSTVVLQVYGNDFGHDEARLKRADFDGNELVGIDGGSNNALISLARESYFLRFVRKSQLLIQTILSNDLDQAYDFERDVKDEQMANTVKIIKTIKSSLDAQGKRLVVFLIPSKSLSLLNNCCIEDVLYTKFYAALAEVNVETIDVKSTFENISIQSELFFERDMHLTSLGHRAIAESIASHISNE